MTSSFFNDEYFENMEQSEKVLHCSSDPIVAKFSYDRLNRYLCAAQIQMQRITENTMLAVNSKPREPDVSNLESTRKYFKEMQRNYDPIFIDIHFYFISWVNCQSMMKVLSSLPEFKDAKSYYHSVKKHFDSYGEARNTFEHFHDRLPAGKFHNKVKEMKEPDSAPRKVYGGLRNGKYLFSDKSWDVTPISLERLEGFVDGFLQNINATTNVILSDMAAKA